MFPASFAGPTIGTGTHAVTWTLAVVVAQTVGDRGHQALIMLAIKLSDRAVKLADLVFNRRRCRPTSPSST